MTGILTTTPRTTQAAILRKVVGLAHPKYALGNIAHAYAMTLVELQTVLASGGYPDRAQMLRKADQLEQSARAEPTADVGDDSGGVYARVPLADLYTDPDNPREHLRDIEDLASSIKVAGLLQPVVARRVAGRLVLVAGHRRTAAARHLAWTEIPCIIRTDIRPDDVLAAMLIENGQRSDLDPIEEARGLGKLKEQLGCNDAELARRVGRSQPLVSSRLALLDLTPDQQEQLRAGNMSLGEAAYKGRQRSGKSGTKGVDRNWHLGPRHTLSDTVKALCLRLGHSRGRTVGGIGCGECWERVIREDERHLQEAL